MKNVERKKLGKKASVRQAILDRLSEQLEYVRNIYGLDDNSWFVICLQGSQNYGIADEESDIDSKLLIIPTLDNLIFNKAAISHTLEMPDNKEHIDVKDIREYFKIIRKSNINFVEVLFTDYYIVNPIFQPYWNILQENAELIARINPYRALAAMRGMAFEKFYALEHEYPSRIHIIEKFGYDPKQLSHLVRIKYFLKDYVAEKSYKDCIYPLKVIREQLQRIKREGWPYKKDSIYGDYKDLAEESLSIIDNIYNEYKDKYKNINNPIADNILDTVLRNIIITSIQNQL